MTEETSDLAGLPDKVIHIGGEDNGLWGLDAISLGGFVNGTLPQNTRCATYPRTFYKL